MSNTCYACTSTEAKARDVAGTEYDLCDNCWSIHIRQNARAVVEGRRQVAELRLVRQIRKAG